MGLIPLDAPWPRDHEPTDAQWDAYGAYLECLMETTWLGQRHLRRKGRNFTQPGDTRYAYWYAKAAKPDQ